MEHVREDIIPELLQQIQSADIQISCKGIKSQYYSRRGLSGGTKELIPLSKLSLFVFFLHGGYSEIDNSVGPITHLSSILPGCSTLNLNTIGIKDALMIGAAPVAMSNIGNCDDFPLYSKVVKEYTELLINTLLQEHLQKSLNDIEESITQKITSSGIDIPPSSPPSHMRRERSRSPYKRQDEIQSQKSNPRDGDRDRDMDRDGDMDRESSRGERVGIMQKLKSVCKYCLKFAYKIVFTRSSLLGYEKKDIHGAIPLASDPVSSAPARAPARPEPLFIACSENKPNKTCELSGDFFIEIACKLREKLKEMDDIRFPFLISTINPKLKNSRCVLTAIDTAKERFGPVKNLKGFGSDIEPQCYNKTLYFHPVNDELLNFGAKIYTIKKKRGKISFVEKIIKVSNFFPINDIGEPIGWTRDATGGQWTTMQDLLRIGRTIGLTEHIIAFDGTCSVLKIEQNCVVSSARGIVLGGGDRGGKINRNRAKIYKKSKHTKRTNYLKKRNKTKRKYMRRK